MRKFRTILVMEDRFDPAKDAINREKHKLPLSFGDRLFEDEDHPLDPPRGQRRTV